MGPFTLIRGSVYMYAVYTVLYCAALLIVSEYRGDLVYKNSAMRATVRAAVWDCGKDLMREPAFDLAFRDNDNDWVSGCVRRAPSARLIAVPDRLLNFWK